MVIAAQSHKDIMSAQPQASRFAAAKSGPAKDRSSGKTIVTGDSGIGKTYFVSTIEAEDGRPIFLIPIEEGLKGASPLHTPGTFTDGGGNPIVPQTFADLRDALITFRDVVNVPRPPDNWFDTLPYPIGSNEFVIIGVLTQAFPQWLPMSVIQKHGAISADMITPGIIDGLIKDKRIMKHANGSLRIMPDSAWKRPHLHLGIDSLSGIEKLVHQEVLHRSNSKAMSDKEYNKSWIEAQPLWQEVQDLLDSIRRSTGTHIWVIAHCTEDFESSPTSGEIYKARDLMLRGSGKTLVEIRQFWRQWADSIWYIMRDVEVRKGDKTRRTMAAHRGRKLVTSETAQCKAKSRLAIPAVLPATWNDVKAALRQLAPAPPERLAERIRGLLPKLDTGIAEAVMADVTAALALPNAVQRLAAILSRVEGLVLCQEEERGDQDGGDDVPPEKQGSDQSGADPQGNDMPPVTSHDDGADLGHTSNGNEL